MAVQGFCQKSIKTLYPSKATQLLLKQYSFNEDEVEFEDKRY